MGEGIIESQAPNASIQVRVKRLEGVRLETGEDTGAVTFNVDVKMEELSRTGDSLTLSFLLSISTRPGLVKFEVGGTATITGGQKAFESVLEEDPESNVPKVLHTIYQHAVPAGMQGRFFTLNRSALSVATPLSLAVGGPLGDRFGVRTLFLAGGAATLAIALVRAFTPAIRALDDEPGAPSRIGATHSL